MPLLLPLLLLLLLLLPKTRQSRILLFENKKRKKTSSALLVSSAARSQEPLPEASLKFESSFCVCLQSVVARETDDVHCENLSWRDSEGHLIK